MHSGQGPTKTRARLRSEVHSLCTAIKGHDKRCTCNRNRSCAHIHWQNNALDGHNHLQLLVTA